MLKKSLCLILCAFLILSCFTACGEVKGSDAGIVFPIDKDPEYLDPQIISFTGSKNIIANCFEGLVTLNGEGEIVPGCAESWSVSPDGLTYTFRLRQDCKWRVSIYAGPLIGLSSKETNSLPVTAQDFDFGITRALLPETKSPVAKALYCIKNAEKVNTGKADASKLGVRAIDELTLEIELEKADPDFLFTLLEPGCMPCNETFFEATGGRYGLAVKYLIYNGPFYINNWVDDVSVSIRKNDYYYDSENTMPRSVYFSINNEQDTRLDKLSDKTYSVSPLTKEQVSEIADSKKYTVSAFDSSILSLAFNCSDSILGNKNIRRAVAATLDCGVLEGELGALTAKGIIPDTMTIGTQRYRDVISAVSLYKNDKPTALFDKGLDALELDRCDISIICTAEYEAAVRKLMQSWQASLGIRCGIFVEVVSETDLMARVNSKNYQLALVPVTYSTNMAFGALERYTSASAENIIGFSDKKYDAMVGEIKHVQGLSQSANKTAEAEKYLIDSATLIPLYSRQIFMAQAKGVSGTYFNLTGDIAYFRHTLSR
ncbi:MAG: peptide ABC transporter substrate-binding protein [Clostridia bacterium]|nr:peptide ABC transporter substrate-binding protein [Clostridia bacterium]